MNTISKDNNNNIAFLFDLDGVLIDSESQFDLLWDEMTEEYHLDVEDIASKVKGTPTVDIIRNYFGHFSPKVQDEIARKIAHFEQNMDINPIPGAYEFLQKTKEAGIRTALVTSSNNEKVDANLAKTPMRPFFDTIVTADRSTKGKPDPMPYLLAAEDLNIPPENCIVFEDSFLGIQSGNAAGMRVIGLATTNSVESIEKDVYRTIPDFSEVAYSDEAFRHLLICAQRVLSHSFSSSDKCGDSFSNTI